MTDQDDNFKKKKLSKSNDSKNDPQYFLTLLDQEYTWPDYYVFRFICNLNNKDNFLMQIKAMNMVEKLVIAPSNKEHYFSISFRMLIHEAQQIVVVYEKLSNIEGIIKI